MTDGVEPALPEDYGALLEQVKAEVRAARLRATRAANSEMLGLYWRVGALILARQALQGWGTRVLERLAADLRAEFGPRGWSRRNLFYMRSLAQGWPEGIVQQAVALLPWGHVTVLLDRLQVREERDWYATVALRDGWSRDVLTHMIASGLRARTGTAPNNFTDRLPTPGSDLARQMLRDPYVFDFLDLTGRVDERALETALMSRLQSFLLELGVGFAFVGRQYHLEVDGDDFVIDLLFFNYLQSRFVVIELKTGRFRPEYVGQLGFYVAWVDENLRTPEHAPTVGILLCTSRSENVVRYSLAGTAAPLAVAGYTYDSLPAAVRASMPSDEQLASALAEAAEQVPDDRQDPLDQETS